MEALRAMIMDTDDQSYRLDDAISNSDLGLFRISPAKYHSVKHNGGDGLDSSGFRMGTAFDIFFLTPDGFTESYVIKPASLEGPSANSQQQQTFCQLLIENPEMDHRQAYRECGYALGNKKEETIDKAADDLFEEMRPWIRFSREAGDRVVLSQDEYTDLVMMRQAIENHPRYADFAAAPDGKSVFNQLKIRWLRTIQVDGDSVREFNLKGMLDRIQIFREEKRVRISDVKTTSKSLSGFLAIIDNYRYDCQAAMYRDAVRALLEESGEDPMEWTIEYFLMAVQTSGLYEAWCVQVPAEVMDEKILEIDDLLRDINWHESTGIWSVSKSAYENDGVITYNPN